MSSAGREIAIRRVRVIVGGAFKDCLFFPSADELLLTEMMFNGLFNNLTSAQSASILSCFVCDEKSNEMPKLTEALSGPLRQMQEMARRIAKWGFFFCLMQTSHSCLCCRVSKDCKLEVNEDSYVETFKPFMMDVVHEWCNGCSFSQLCKMTDLFEGTQQAYSGPCFVFLNIYHDLFLGSIIRCMRRLEELLRQMVQAAKNIGNSELENKFADAIKLMKRDIVFAASLYL